MSNERGLRRFCRIPWSIYRNDPNWVPPLLSEVRRELDPKSNPFWRTAERKLFCARDANNQLTGRIAAIHNPGSQSCDNEAVGFFGYFESIDQIEVADKLLEAATLFIKGRGCTSLIGPVNPSTNGESGLLLEGPPGRPMFMTNYCPAYYHQLLTECGFIKAIDTFSYQAEYKHDFPMKYERVLRRVLCNSAISIRSFSRKDASRDTAIIGELYNAAFCDTWGFVPMSSAESQQMAESFLRIADPELVWIAFYRGEPAGFILGLPDLNEILASLNGRLLPFGFITFLAKRNRIRTMRLIALGVAPKFRSLGIEAALVMKERERIVSRPYRLVEFSVVMENNIRMRTLIRTFGFRPYRSYRIYRRDVQ